MVCIIIVKIFTLAWKKEKVVGITFKHLKKLEYPFYSYGLLKFGWN